MFKRLKAGYQRALLTALRCFLVLAINHAAFDKSADLLVQPNSLFLSGASSDHGLLVSLSGSDSRPRDVTSQCQVTSERPNIVEVLGNGHLRAVTNGATTVVVSFQGKTARVPVTVSGADQTTVPSFRQDILPLLTRYNCNAGGCHGKLTGQNGFRLSLRGFAPEWDYDWLTKEDRSRRINTAFPEESLLVQKPLAKAPHEGGQKFAEDSRAHKMLIDWIRARAPGPDAAESDASRIEVLPAKRTLKPGEKQQLLVRAHYPNGSVRDVTWVSKFVSNDDSIVAVSAEGTVEALRSGETSVRVHFQGLVEVVMLTMPYTNAVPRALFSARNNAVDDAVFAKLRALNIPPSADSDDATFVRRVFLDTIGTLPSSEESARFFADKRRNKKAVLIDDLLARPEYVDFWTLQLADLLQNRKERDHDVRGTKGVRAFHEWLREEVAMNRPWNELAREIITSTGDVASNPGVGYYITTIGEKKGAESEAVDAVAQSFLGTRIGCAKCHNHPLERYTQDDYYHFAAFFSRMSLKREDPDKGTTVLAACTEEERKQREEIAKLEQSLGPLSADAEDDSKAAVARPKLEQDLKKLQETRQKLAKLEKSDKPGTDQPRTHQFMAPQPLDRSPVKLKAGEDPRTELASWITDPKNSNFSGSMVNRIWKHFMGVGLVEQVDDLRASNPPSNPELWELLNKEFVSHGYDLKHVMRLVLNSRTYQLASATIPGNERDRKFYSHYYARRLPAEVLADAISQAADVPDKFDGYPIGIRAIQLPEPGVSSYFLSLFGRSDRVTACACERSGEVTLPQLLHLSNGEELLKKIDAPEGRLQNLFASKSSDAVVTQSLYLTTLGRLPDAAESETVSQALDETHDSKEAFRDLFWALLNSKEFAFNH